eukprot:GSChrysophyteH1.ASY1.ANO1.2623.1 assembled CDS
MKSQKEKATASGSALAAFELEEDENVFDTMDEDAYRDHVEKRRNAGDFVVDDGKSGYADDGEEILGIAEDESDAKKRAAKAMDLADQKLSKRARGIAEAGRQQHGQIMNFARSGVNEAKRKTVVVKEVSKDHELDIDSIMDDAPQAAEVGPRASRGRPIAKAAIKRAPVAMRNSQSSWHNPTDAMDDFMNGGGNEADMLTSEDLHIKEEPDSQMEVESEGPGKKVYLGRTSRKLKLEVEDTLTSNGVSLSNEDASAWLKKPEQEGEDEYMNFYYLDANETNGVVYLFGKVDKLERKYVSCCVSVHNCERNLFILPRKTGEFDADRSPKRANFQDVYGEINKLLIPSVIPKKAGMGFRCAKKKRNYAFEHGSVPREETEYLKRDLMGPCWLKIRKPCAPQAKISLCKLEVAVDSPKNINVSKEKLDVPPLVAMSVSIKTAVNPMSHTHEVISIAGLIHKQVQADVDTEVLPQHMSRFTYFPHDLQDAIKRAQGNSVILQTFPNERAMLSKFFNKIGVEDPDILASHNLFGFEFDVILNRAVTNKVPGWDRLGRLRKARPPKSINDSNAISGRILCDTYKAAKEFLRETTYSLKHLAESQLGRQRREVDPVDVPRFFSSSKDIINLYRHTENDTLLVQSLMLKLQVIPLTKQLTNLSGNLWSRTMRGGKAERIEYLLLHKFHQKKYILPEKKPYEKKANPGNNKAAYAGGLVLEPKKGLYDTFILLLDFNSLYPSLIQEYNLCFTTEEGDESGGAQELPPLPDSSLQQGILPQVIKMLVERRKVVKQALKNERNPTRRQEYDIRQKALKLTANSMYGCLGFSFSRFYARPIAALVTAKGREALQWSVDVAQRQMNLDVIYGDTDSIMINTNKTNLAEVKQLGLQSMLLLKKKKYAALTIEERDGKIIYDKELKGLDLVRRDWAPVSKNAGKHIVDTILSTELDREAIVLSIHDYLANLANDIRDGKLGLAEFIVTKGLNKNPKDYPDVKGQPHLQVALRMLAQSQPVNIGDHIPYVICKEGEEGATAPQRAYHPDEVHRSEGKLTIDYEWYLTNQILPPINRLCEPIDGTSQAAISEKLGLDSSKFANKGSSDDIDYNDWDYKPMHMRDDAERFAGVDLLKYNCINRLTMLIRSHTHKYYDGWAVCDNPYCKQRTRRQSLRGDACMADSCKGQGHLVPEYNGRQLHTQMKYLLSLFDADVAIDKKIRAEKAKTQEIREDQVVSRNELHTMGLLKTHMENAIEWSGYNWVEPQLWTSIFAKSLAA